jgi:hypothetical protein
MGNSFVPKASSVKLLPGLVPADNPPGGVGRPSGPVDVRTSGADGLVSTEFLLKAVFGSLHDVLRARVHWCLVEDRTSSSPSIEIAMSWSPCVEYASSHFVPRIEPGIVASLPTVEPNTESVSRWASVHLSLLFLPLFPHRTKEFVVFSFPFFPELFHDAVQIAFHMRVERVAIIHGCCELSDKPSRFDTRSIKSDLRDRE